MRTIVLAGLISIGVAGSAIAQTVRGVVAGSDDRPINGVVVVLVDAASKEVGRALTDERGEYRLTAPAPGSYRLRTLRIGYRSLMTPPVVLAAGDDITRRLTVSTLVVSLDTVRATGRNVCRVVAGDSTSAVAGIWEQVRSALIATQLSLSRNLIYSTSITYQRMLDARSRHVGSRMADVRADFARQPWTSLPVDSLRKVGYVFTTRDNARMYFAPDLAVLLSDFFLQDHCLRIAKSSDDRRLGIEFEPTSDRDDVTEIRGTLWLDRKTNELLGLEYRYANRIRSDEERIAGGEVGFAHLENGLWAISNWSIRMPVPVAVPVYSSGFRVSRYDMRLDSIKVTGGELVLATTTGTSRDTIWMREPMSFHGVVLDSATGAPLSRAIVTLAGTGRVDTTDASGRFVVRDVLPGRYRMSVAGSAVDSPTAPRTLVLADTSMSLTVRVATVSSNVVEPTAPGVAEPRAPAAKPAVLDSVVTKAASTSPLMTEFEQHRKSGVGHFITREEIEKREGGSTASVLQALPGLRVWTAQGGDWPFNSSQRCNAMNSLDRDAASAGSACSLFYVPTRDEARQGLTSRCFTKVYVDRALMNPGTPTPPYNLREITPREIQAIEYYSQPAEMPVQYRTLNSGCGLIIIHTRR